MIQVELLNLTFDLPPSGYRDSNVKFAPLTSLQEVGHTGARRLQGVVGRSGALSLKPRRAPVWRRRPKLRIEADGGLVPVQHGPLQPPTVPLFGSSR